MKRLSGVLAVLAVLAASSASAKDMSGKFGVGYDQSLGGVSGLDLAYFIGDIKLTGTISFEMFAPKKGDNPTAFAAAIGGIYQIARSENANLGVGLKLDLGFKNKAAMGVGSSFQVNIEVPIIAEYFFSDFFSIHAGTGLLFVIVPEKGCALNVPNSPNNITNAAAQGFGFGLGNGSLLGNAGFTFYF